MTAPLRLTLAVDSTVWGGAEASVASLLGALPEPVSCTVLATAGLPERLATAARARGTLVEVAPVAGKTDLSGLRAMASALRATRPDVVHLNQSMPTNNRHLFAMALAVRVPVVPVLHLWGDLLSRPQTAVLSTLYRGAARVVGVSRPIADRLAGELRLPPERVDVVRNGVPLPPPATGSGQAVPVVGAVGRLVEQKGFDVLVGAVRRLVDAGTPLQVVVAGEGELATDLAAVSADLPVRWLGGCDDVPALLAGLDLFVLPSRDEGLPLALLEAMGAGLPCVASDVGDIATALTGVGRLVPPDDEVALADALAAYLADPAARARDGAAARRTVEDSFSDTAHAEAMLAVYRWAAR